VVVVDDDRDGCEVLARLLELDGYRVHRAAGQDELLALTEAQPVDLVVLALEGAQDELSQRLLVELRATPGLAKQDPRVVLIARSEHARTIFATTPGSADAILSRPFAAADLRRIVAQALAPVAADRPGNRNG